MVTPLGFARLAAAVPEGRLGETMGAGEVGRELGDAGGPAAVGAFGLGSLAAGFTTRAIALLLRTGLALHKTTKGSSPRLAPRPQEASLS